MRKDDGVGGLTGKIIGAAITVHRELGPGLLESAYETCLVEELRVAGIATERQVPVPLTYRGVHLECGYRIDVLVEGKVIVELKVVSALNKVHVAQVLTHLRLRNLTVGLLLNFNVEVLAAGGIKRVFRTDRTPVSTQRALGNHSRPKRDERGGTAPNHDQPDT